MNESKLLRYFGGDRSLAAPLERIIKQMIESGTKAKTIGQEKILVNRSSRKNQYYVVVRIKEHHPVVSLVGVREMR
ncbi:hypothetical protein AGMMS4952_11020 [Spirochaetia bacterium]|nr:hypothetical protein AGMMS4952_11020 [Spirochaetia bacterium]